jgi:tripartite-type tricarboxylate transporter receptor subunit TctC
MIPPRAAPIAAQGGTTMKRRSLILLAAALPAPALAQGTWPDRPIRVVVPFAAGGPSDIVVRLLAPRLSSALGQPIVVDNRAGAGGVTGVDAVAKAAPDGNTIGIGSAGGLAISPRLDRGTPYDPLRDLAPLTLAVLVPEPLVVPAAAPFRTVADLVAAAKAQPGRLNYGSAGSGSMPHLAGELFRMAAGIDITHVSYRGGAPLALAILQNEVQLGFADLPILLPHIRSGALRALAVGTQQRLEWIPDVPTMTEVGLPGVDANNWHGFVAPARTPQPMLDRLHAALAGALNDSDIRRALHDQGAVPGGNSPAEFAAFLRAELDKWGGVVQRAGVRAD